MIYLLGIAGLLIGIVIGALAASRKSKVALAVAEQRLSDIAGQLDAEKLQIQTLRDSLAESDRNLAIARTQIIAAEKNLLDQRTLLDSAQHQLRLAFASASAEALSRNNEAFLQLAKERFATISAEAVGSLDQRKEQIDALLKPMRELMDQYQIRVGEIEKSRVESYSMLREQLGALAESQRTLNTQTSQLVTALSRPTVRGQWGEISLRRLVELAGLSNRCDFVEQESVDTEQGRFETRHGRQSSRPARHRHRLQNLFRRLPRRRRRHRRRLPPRPPSTPRPAGPQSRPRSFRQKLLVPVFEIP